MGIVLVVEDDDDLRKAICQALGDEGIATAPAENGAEALSILARGERPSLILLELMMPVMNGWTFRARQEADPRFAAIPVIIMTAAARLDDAAIAGSDLLRKPLRLEELIERVHFHLGAQEFESAPKTTKDRVPTAVGVEDSGSHDKPD